MFTLLSTHVYYSCQLTSTIAANSHAHYCRNSRLLLLPTHTSLVVPYENNKHYKAPNTVKYFLCEEHTYFGFCFGGYNPKPQALYAIQPDLTSPLTPYSDQAERYKLLASMICIWSAFELGYWADMSYFAENYGPGVNPRSDLTGIMMSRRP